MFATEITTIANNIKQIMPIIDSELILESEEYNKNDDTLYSILYSLELDDIVVDMLIEIIKVGECIKVCICGYLYDIVCKYEDFLIPINCTTIELPISKVNYCKLLKKIWQVYDDIS